jgi:hypothetical protein
VYPEFVVVNINAPAPAGTTQLDNPSFYGATREDYPLPFLRVMGASGPFGPWRVVRARTISWFYEGAGGNFDYWPEGPEGPMRSEQPRFGNVALCADTDRIYHRIGSIGDPDAVLPRSRRRRRFSRTATATGKFWRTKKCAPLTQATRFGFPCSGKRHFGPEHQTFTI